MTNKPRAKGTSGEREVLAMFHGTYPGMVRNPSSATTDLHLPGPGRPLDVLACRADGGRWMVTVLLDDLLRLLAEFDWPRDEVLRGRPELRVEVKRYKAFAHTALYDKKFGRG